jgi:c-di-GMP-binding flagellar brake protein YcgR
VTQQGGGDGSNKRKHERRAFELPITVSDAANRVVAIIQFSTQDLSLGGAFVRSHLLFEINEILSLQFSLPDGRQVRAQGKVVRVSRDSGDDVVPGMGVQFIDLPDEDRAALQRLLGADAAERASNS